MMPYQTIELLLLAILTVLLIEGIYWLRKIAHAMRDLGPALGPSDGPPSRWGEGIVRARRGLAGFGPPSGSHVHAPWGPPVEGVTEKKPEPEEPEP
jgi:hypothetical protein